MKHATGEAKAPSLRPTFDRRIKLEFHGAKITSDGGLLAYRELDGALELTEIAITKLLDGRRGKNTRHKLGGLFRQSVFGRLAGYEDVNDAERLARDPAMRAIVGRGGLDRAAASSSQVARFETEWLATDANMEALRDLSASGATVCMHESRPPASFSTWTAPRVRRTASRRLRPTTATSDVRATPGEYGPFDNLLPLADEARTRFAVLKALADILIDSPGELRSAQDIILSGSGYAVLHKSFGPYMWSELEELESLIRPLTLGQCVYALIPGEWVEFGDSGSSRGRCDWIIVDGLRREQLMRAQKSFLLDRRPRALRPLLGRFDSFDAALQARQVVEAELWQLAKFILHSGVGILALALDRYMEQLGPERIVFRFLQEPWGGHSTTPSTLTGLRSRPFKPAMQKLFGAFPSALKCI